MKTQLEHLKKAEALIVGKSIISDRLHGDLQWERFKKKEFHMNYLNYSGKNLYTCPDSQTCRDRF